MQKEGTARLDFIQNIEYKFIELLYIDFVNSPDDTVRKQISYRYNALRTKLELMQNRIQAISNIVRIKNPSLLLQIQKAPAKLNLTSIGYLPTAGDIMILKNDGIVHTGEFPELE